MADDDFWPISGFAMQQAQFYDCKRCRCVVLDRDAHVEWHRKVDKRFAACGAVVGP